MNLIRKNVKGFGNPKVHGNNFVQAQKLCFWCLESTDKIRYSVRGRVYFWILYNYMRGGMPFHNMEIVKYFGVAGP